MNYPSQIHCNAVIMYQRYLKSHHSNSIISKIGEVLSSFFWVPILIAFSTGCSPLNSVEPTITSPPTPQPVESTPEMNDPIVSIRETSPTSPITTQTPVTTPDPAMMNPSTQTQYSLNAALDYANHTLQVSQEILYYNSTPAALPDIMLVIEPNRYQGTFRLSTLSVNGISIDDPNLENNQMLIQLESPLPPEQPIQINISYDLYLPSPQPSQQIRPIPFGYTSRQTNLVDWYPYIPPYDPDTGWLVHKPWFYGEHQVYEISDFMVSIQLLDKREDLVIAASAPGKKDGDRFIYQQLDARNFVWSVSHTYDILQEQVGDVLVIGYSFPFDRAAAEAVMKTTVEALTLYQELFGPYHRDTLTVVEADFLDGMEFDGMYFLSYGFYNSFNGTSSDYLIAIAAHETAHQWWYAQVGNDQAMDPWLDEAMCTYSERLYYERYDPSALGWWWAYRINYYQPGGFINRSIYETTSYLDYRDSIYLNGALFFEDLRSLIQDEPFFAFLNGYASQYNSELSSTEHFFRTLAEFTDQDINQLLSTYFK